MGSVPVRDWKKAKLTGNISKSDCKIDCQILMCGSGFKPYSLSCFKI
jgi:hypothetical protein